MTAEDLFRREKGRDVIVVIVLKYFHHCVSCLFCYYIWI